MNIANSPAEGRSSPDELLSVTEAALAYGLPEWKVSRLIRENQLEGARKVRGEHSPVWRIPAAALEARGFTRQVPTPAGPEATVTLELAELRRTLQSLTGTLRIERQRLANKQQELEDALLQIGQLRRELKYERTRREDAEEQGRSPPRCNRRPCDRGPERRTVRSNHGPDRSRPVRPRGGAAPTRWRRRVVTLVPAHVPRGTTALGKTAGKTPGPVTWM